MTIRRRVRRAIDGGSPPGLRDGGISVVQLRAWAAQFDALDAELYTAADFVAWLKPEVRPPPRRTISAAGKARIAAGQHRRWERYRQGRGRSATAA